MNIKMRFKLFRGKPLSLVLGLTAFFAVVTLGITMAPSISAPLRDALVGNYADKTAVLPTGQIITPLAVRGSTFEPLSTGLRADGSAAAHGAVATALSPDGKTLLALTSGYNKNFNTESGNPITYSVLNPITGQPSDVTTQNAEWVFVYDVNRNRLVKQQQISLPNTFNGIVWAPDGERFYVSAGIDDRIYVYRKNGGEYVPDAPFILLGHNSNSTEPLPSYDGGLLKGTDAEAASTGAVAAGLDVSKDGRTLVAANFENDSISIVDIASRQVVKEIKFFEPGDIIPARPLW